MRGLPADGETIRSLRKMRGLTQEALADRAGVDVKTVRHAEGSRSLDAATLRAVSEALSVDLAIVLRGTPHSRSVEERNAAIARLWQATFDRRDVEALVGLYREDATLCYPPPVGECVGREALREHFRYAFDTFETEPITQLVVHAAADYAFLRARATARVRATGAAFSADGMHEFRFEAGKIVLHVGYFDMRDLLASLDGTRRE